MNLPRYSVIIPAYNCEELLRETVLSALAQTHPPFEVIILDDKSTDSTLKVINELAAEFPVIRSYPNHRNLGVANTRNIGFEKSRGEYIALLDADDMWMPEKMEKQITLMVEKGCDFSYTGYSFIDSQGKPINKTYNVPETITLKDMLKENYIGCATVVLTREIAKNYTMEKKYSHEDYVLWLELLQDGKKPCGINQPLMIYRLSPHSRSGNKKKAAKDRWHVYRGFLGLGRVKSTFYFVQYAIRGFLKHKI